MEEQTNDDKQHLQQIEEYNEDKGESIHAGHSSNHLERERRFTGQVKYYKNKNCKKDEIF